MLEILYGCTVPTNQCSDICHQTQSLHPGGQSLFHFFPTPLELHLPNVTKRSSLLPNVYTVEAESVD